MQFSTVGWTSPSQVEQAARTGSAKFVAWLRGIKVFRTPRKALTVFAVAVPYWFFATTMSREAVFNLLRAAHTAGYHHAILMSLALIGAFVTLNDAIHAALERHFHKPEIASLVLSTLLVAATIVCWTDAKFFTVFCELAAAPCADWSCALLFSLSNCIVLATNILFPAIGVVYLVRLIRSLA